MGVFHFRSPTRGISEVQPIPSKATLDKKAERHIAESFALQLLAVGDIVAEEVVLGEIEDERYVLELAAARQVAAGGAAARDVAAVDVATGQFVAGNVATEGLLLRSLLGNLQ
ncbi:hypothetical protein N7533_003866 [Penicillium manginii]|uniref:uncharacterized protein n=1 Tax=Penicillium manginii TaxID=203109 RepID=UPI00254839CA|nr:uncharacterized protein N7533_003866 [Penicillium manginii]KAJ5754323.1 hypothetical protein N7533_003866 [Penicillium manginii]